MDRLSLLRTFVAAFEAGSFTAAAVRLGSDPKLVSKHIAALEAFYGLRLFQRTTRSISVTEAGRRLYDGAFDLLSQHDDLDAAVRADATLIAGRLRVSAPVSWGETSLMPQLRAFLAANPNVELDLRLSDRFVDLSEEGFDLALRIGGPALSALIGRTLGETRMILVASPRLLASLGTPASAAELPRFPQVGDSNLRGGQLWPLSEGGIETLVPVRGRFMVNSATAAARLAAEGEGLALVPDYVAEPMVNAGALELVLPSVTGPLLTIRAVFRDGRRMPLRVRRLVDFLAAGARDS